MNKLYILIIAFLISNSIIGQVVSIGTGNERTSGLPIDPFYRYSYTQEIYLASEINQTGDIFQLIFKVAQDRQLDNSNEWIVYLAHTTKTSFDSTTDWVSSNELTQVYSGTFSHTSGDDVVLTLDTTFPYNGTDNLLLAIEDNSSGFDSGDDDLLASAVSENRAIMYRNDNTNPDPESPPTATNIQAFVANINISFETMDSCNTAQTTIDENFESYPAGAGEPLPDCWSSIGAGMTIGNRNTDGEANSGSNYISAYIGFSNNQDGYIISPKLSTIDGNHEADFFIKASIPGATYQLGTMSDPTDADTFSNIGTVTALSTGYINVNTGNILATSDEYFTIKFSAPTQHTVIRIDDFKWQSSTLSIDSVIQDHFSIYPNPSDNGIVTIQLNNTQNVGETQVFLYTMTGQQVFASTVKTNTSIDTSHLKPGIYLLQLQSNSIKSTKKLILK